MQYTIIAKLLLAYWKLLNVCFFVSKQYCNKFTIYQKTITIEILRGPPEIFSSTSHWISLNGFSFTRKATKYVRKFLRLWDSKYLWLANKLKKLVIFTPSLFQPNLTIYLANTHLLFMFRFEIKFPKLIVWTQS